MASTADLVAPSVADLTLQDPTEPKPFLRMTAKEKLRHIRKVITVEPLIAAYVMSSILCAPALNNLEFEKACRVNLAYNDTVCEAILAGEHLNYTEHNEHVQELISNMHSWQVPLQSVMPLLLVLFLGSFSDRHQLRKPFLLLPLFGELFAVIGCILCVVFMRSWPLEAQGVSQTVVPSFFGGQTMIVMAVFAYISDVSSLEMRTLRIGVLQIVLNVSVPLVSSFSGLLFAAIGYVGVLLIAGGLYLFALIYGVFWIEEPRKPIREPGKGILVDMFNPKHALDTFGLVLKKNPDNNRAFLLVILVTLFVYAGVSVGEAGLFYLYTQKIFKWTPVEFSYLITVNTLVHLAGTAVAVPLFTKVLKLSDIAIIVITFADKIIANVIFALADSVTLLYVAVAVSFITGVTPIGIRSLTTKIVPQQDLGKAQSLFGICEAIAPAIVTPLYNSGIYVTFKDLPAAFFYFGAFLYIVCAAGLICMFVWQKSHKTPEEHKNGLNATEKSFPDGVQVTHI